ncbi:Uncharacterised protein [Bordetella pertussis]|nr:Uncharacterised protein [Bordetella pertussis]
MHRSPAWREACGSASKMARITPEWHRSRRALRTPAVASVSMTSWMISRSASKPAWP